MPVLPAPPEGLEPMAMDVTLTATLGMGGTVELRADRPALCAYIHMTRVADKAIREYNEAREGFEAVDFSSIAEPGDPARISEITTVFNRAFRASDHLESCVESTHRAVVMLDLLRGRGFGWHAQYPKSDTARRLKDIRDAMQHSGDRLIGDLLPGRRAFDLENLDPYCLSPRGDHVLIGSERPLKYVELIDLMATCYHAAKAIGRTAPDSA